MTKPSPEPDLQTLLLRGDPRPGGCPVPHFQLLQWKYAMKLEALGLRHSSGRSVRAHACRKLGLKPRTPVPVVIDAIDAILRLALSLSPTEGEQ